MKPVRPKAALLLLRLASRVDGRRDVKYSRTIYTPQGWNDALYRGAKGLDAFGPGAADAARAGIDLSNRYAGRVGVAGLFEKLVPEGENPIGNSWMSKIVAGMAGSRPAMPNAAPVTVSWWRRLWNAARTRMTRIGDHLERNDYGYPLGLLGFVAACFAAFFGVWLAAVPLFVAAFVLCWWFG